MNKSQIIELQKTVGAEPDGFWGRDSINACQEYLHELMPRISYWPKSDQASVAAFYGKPGSEVNLMELDVKGLGIKYEGNVVKLIRCHDLVGASLLRVLKKLKETSPEVLALYDGCFNFRKMRGGNSWSMHAWGIAVDFDASNNGNSTSWPLRATMPLKVMEAFSREGWLSAGAFWGRDAMHFQATQ
jgi:hypothetical protein